MCLFVLEVMRKMLNEVLLCVYVISRVHCALGCVHILLTLLFLHSELQVHVKCKRFILFYITLLSMSDFHVLGKLTDG